MIFSSSLLLPLQTYLKINIIPCTPTNFDVSRYWLRSGSNVNSEYMLPPSVFGEIVNSFKKEDHCDSKYNFSSLQLLSTLFFCYYFTFISQLYCAFLCICHTSPPTTVSSFIHLLLAIKRLILFSTITAHNTHGHITALLCRTADFSYHQAFHRSIPPVARRTSTSPPHRSSWQNLLDLISARLSILRS